MARWLIELAALTKYPPAASYFSPSAIAIAAGLAMSMCCVIVILSMCSFCDVIKRERVGDKASSSDSDASPAAGGKQAFFMQMTAKKWAMSTAAQGLTKEEGKLAAGEHEQGKLSPHVWQRAIMMGERCKRPNFSGLILYDEKGNPLPRRFPM